jgi:hypothetical protein
MRHSARQTRENRTITVDFQNEATYYLSVASTSWTRGVASTSWTLVRGVASTSWTSGILMSTEEVRYVSQHPIGSQRCPTAPHSRHTLPNRPPCGSSGATTPPQPQLGLHMGSLSRPSSVDPFLLGLSCAPLASHCTLGPERAAHRPAASTLDATPPAASALCSSGSAHHAKGVASPLPGAHPQFAHSSARAQASPSHHPSANARPSGLAPASRGDLSRGRPCHRYHHPLAHGGRSRPDLQPR